MGLGAYLFFKKGSDKMADKIQYHVFFLDVGQGEATFIIKRVIPDKGETKCYTLLIDTDKGNIIDTIFLIKDCIPKITKGEKEVHFIDAMVITHPHDDHIGGLDSLVNDAEISVSKIFHPDYDFIEDRNTSDYKAYNKLRKNSSNQSETRLVAGNEYGSNTGIVFTAISPPKTIDKSETFKDQPEKIQIHNQCAVITLDLNGTKILFLGDSNKECMKRLMQYHKDELSASILSASHHGSNSIFVPEIEIEENLADIKRDDKDWDEGFLDTINPEHVVISCGAGNTYKHPHSAALKAYQANDRTVIRTDNNGTVYFVIDNDGSYTSPTYLKKYDDVKKTIKGLFPTNAKTNDSVKSFFVGGSSLPVPPRNA